MRLNRFAAIGAITLAAAALFTTSTTAMATSGQQEPASSRIALSDPDPCPWNQEAQCYYVGSIYDWEPVPYHGMYFLESRFQPNNCLTTRGGRPYRSGCPINHDSFDPQQLWRKIPSPLGADWYENVAHSEVGVILVVRN